MDFPFSRNGLIVTEPMESQQVKACVVDGFARAGQRTTLTRLRVLMPYAGSPALQELCAGSHIWVRAICYTSAWAKAQYDIDVCGDGGTTAAILVPESEIVLFADPDSPPVFSTAGKP
jgi:hypothetical protein